MFAKIKKKYKTMSLVAKAGIWFSLCTIIQKGVAFFTVPIFTRIMPTYEYGLYSTYLSWYGIMTIICTLDMHNCIYINRITKSNNDADKDNEAIPLLSLSSLITMLLYIVYLIFHKTINKWIGLPTGLISLMFLQVFFDPVINFWLIRQKFDYKYKNIVIRTILLVSLNAILGIIFVLIVNTNQAVARAISIVLVQIVFGIMFYISFFKKTNKIFSIKGWKHALKIQLPLLPHALSLTILNSADRIMINSLSGAIKAATYSVAYSAAFVVNVIKNALVDAVRPEIYKCIKNKRYEEINIWLKQLTFLILITIIVFIIFAPEVIKIMAPKEYYEAVYIIPPVAISTYFTLLYAIFSCISLYYEKTKRIMISSISVAIINIILNYIFIPIFGYLSAGYTTLCCYMLLAVVHFIIMKQVCKQELNNVRIFDLKFISLTSLCVILLMFIVTYSYQFFIIRYSILVILVIICIFNKKKIIDLCKSFIK